MDKNDGSVEDDAESVCSSDSEPSKIDDEDPFDFLEDKAIVKSGS